jgi:hypothetical protein
MTTTRPSSQATALVDELVLALQPEQFAPGVAETRRAALLAYLADLEGDLAGDLTGPFTALPREDGRVDVVRLGDVGTGTDQPRHLVAEAVSPSMGVVAASVLNALACAGILPGRSPTAFAFDFWPRLSAADPDFASAITDALAQASGNRPVTFTPHND